MFNIRTLNNISPAGLNLFPRDRYRITADILEPDAILIRSFSMNGMNLPERLLAIARAGAGVNNIPVGKCSELGIAVFNTPGANANAVKELALAGLLLASRNIAAGISWIKSLQVKGNELSKQIEEGKSVFAGPELLGKTIGVIGLGAIGHLVANAADSLGMKVIGYDPFISVDLAWKLSQKVQKAKSLDHLFSESDYISLHVPLIDSTREFINQAKFQNMKIGVRIINFARDGLIKPADLIQALNEGKVACFVTDFPEDGLLHHEKVITIPHLGASTPESENNCATMAVNQLMNYLENGNTHNSVNFPDTDMPWNGGHRLCVVNKNIPKMMGQITTVLANEEINIEDMLNRHHDNLAYNIIDINKSISEKQLDILRKIEGVVRVRLIPPNQ